MNQKSFLTLLILFLCGPFMGFGRALADGDSSSSSSPPAPFEFSKPTGKVNEYYGGFFQRFSGYPNELERLDLEVEESLTNMTWTAKAVPWVYGRAPDPVGGYYSNARPYFEMKEGWIERVNPEFDVRLGNQIITWGTADAINPTDQWNALDQVDPFNSKKLPQATLKIDIHPTVTPDYTLQVLFTPFFRANELPFYIPSSGTTTLSKNQSRWFLPLPDQLQAGPLEVPLSYTVAAPTYASTWQGAARFQAMRMGGWDYSLSYQNIVEKVPRFSFNKTGNPNDASLPLNIELLPSFHRSQVFGVDGAGSIKLDKNTALGARFEVAYNLRDNSQALAAEQQYQADLIKDDFIEATLGGDYTFQKKILGTVIYTNFMYIHYQYVKKVVQAPAGATTVAGLPNVQPFDRNALIYVESRISPTLKLSNAVLGSFQDLDGFDSPAFTMQVTDALKASVGLDIFFGRPTGFYGQFDDNTRGTFSGTYTF